MSLAGTVNPLARRRYVDWTRGIAVLIMMEAHTLDSWTSPVSRSTTGFYALSMLAGFAAPLFLWLAGLSLVLSAERRLAHVGSRLKATEAAVRRGAEIFILAFLFRLQAFLISPGSWAVTLFRVDILNIMGPTLAVAALLWGASGGARRAALVCAFAASVIAMTTPLVRSAAWVGTMPLWLQWYVRPFGDQTTFTLFPWAGFVLAGASVGSLLAIAPDPLAERRTLGALTVVGGVLLWLGFYTASLPSIYASSSFWTSSPTFFSIRLGVMLVALGVVFLASALLSGSSRWLVVLETFGHNSLFVYWVHVELVYGYATWVLRRRLPLSGIGIAFVALAALMYQTIGIRDKALDKWTAYRSKALPAPAGPSQAEQR